MIVEAKKLILICLIALGGCQTKPIQVQISATPETVYESPSGNNNSIDSSAYYVSPSGNDDTNTGTKNAPWQTINKATSTVSANSIIYVRGGTYAVGGEFKDSNITVKNYPGEQVIIQLIKGGGYRAFDCYTVRARSDIHIIGSDVIPQKLSNGVISKKGIVIQGLVGSQWMAFYPHGGCDRWEIAGIDFVDVGYGIFQEKESYSQMGNLSSDNWYIHDNRVYGFYREAGMQFNGNDNIIENNEITKVTPQLDTPYGCYLINILGHGNIVRGNKLTGTGGTECDGILFEWSQSDANLIENNIITGVPTGIRFQGGDNNIIQNNTVIGTIPPAPGYDGIIDRAGVEIISYSDDKNSWPCDDYVGAPGFEGASIPPNNPAHPDYPYYYPYGECQSYGNQIIGNTISGFTDGIMFINGAPKIGTTVISGNTITGWTRGKVCNYSKKTCKKMPSNVYINTAPPNSPTP